MSIGIREAWLLNAVEHLKPVFERVGSVSLDRSSTYKKEVA
jgi:hypothetical protein